jgi:hypothetical protein
MRDHTALISQRLRSTSARRSFGSPPVSLTLTWCPRGDSMWASL